MIRFFAAACLFALTVNSASAEWVHGVENDAFNGDRYWAQVGDFTTQIGFSCVKGGELRLYYVLPDHINEEANETFNGKHTYELSFLVDDEAPQTAPAKIWYTRDGTHFLADIDEVQVVKSMVFKVLYAQKRFAVALKVDGKMREQSTWEAESSRQSVLALTDGCGLSEDKPTAKP